MKKLIALALALILLLPCLAQAEAPVYAAQGATITVTGCASVTLKADYARISVGVSTHAPTVEEASRRNNNAIHTVIAALMDAGVQEDDIATSNYSVSAEYDYAAVTPRLTGYCVTNQLTVVIRDMEHIGATLDKATAAGANNIYNIEFLSTNAPAAQDEATAYAVQDAVRKAALLADSAGLTLGGIVSIQESSTVLPQPRTYKSAMNTDTAGNSILPDDASVSATVTIVFELK
ncbi:MAG: SIMPL domain-containing protein [Clostridia bacterium]|nr:SIMPL domain-containing protein [Clostridia bacterium]